MSVVSATSSSTSVINALQPKTQSSRALVNPRISCLCDKKIENQLGLKFRPESTESHRITIRCHSSTGTGNPGSGDNESKSVLDSFFLGKALAEEVNERLESAVGEFFSTIGRLQAVQQKQILEFQEDVLLRAKKAKEKAAVEAMEAQGLVPKPSVDTTSATNGATMTTSPSTNRATNYAAEPGADSASNED